jgi:bis(5'-nucleosyl)-tetraphosphatase (symmetrical)
MAPGIFPRQENVWEHMAVFAVGDLQGCYKEFRSLLDLINFDKARDRLWLVGDLVNRGPDSLSVLRFVKELGDAATVVLGNHDLHLLMVAEGCAELHQDDTLREILRAPDRHELLDWLRHQKLLHVDGTYVMVHAGLLPGWTVEQARLLAQRVEESVQSGEFQEFCSRIRGNYPDRWVDSLAGEERARVVINAMTRMRVCTPDGRMNFTYKGPIENTPSGYVPWFEVPDRASEGAVVICGHWSAMGLRMTENIMALDTGCVWGGKLTAVRLSDRRVFQVPCAAGEGTGRRR